MEMVLNDRRGLRVDYEAGGFVTVSVSLKLPRPLARFLQAVEELY